MEITAQQVKELRELTGVGFMDCKKALAETNGNTDAAVDWLRTRGLAKAAKKAGRIAAEGLIGIASNGKSAAMVEVNSETDFVARNEEFQKLVAEVAKLALGSKGDVAILSEMAYPGTGRSVDTEISEAIARIGENMNLRRTDLVTVTDGIVATYVHNAAAPDLGRIGILVGIESTGDAAVLSELGRQIAQHVAATSPLSLSPDDLDPEVVQRERAVFKEQAIESGKPADIAEKMVEGRMRKYHQEVCLLAQQFVHDDQLSVADAIKAREADAGAPIKLTRFVRFALGEGIEKEQTDFAAEVAATAANS